MCIRDSFDIAALPRYDLAGQIQANAHALLFVYFFLTIEAPEDGSLIAFGNAPVSYTHLSCCNISRTFGFYNTLINR